MSALLIFGLLLALMLTGMPISISLGLTVLTFLFTMTDVPIESVALKLFTGIEKFEIMAVPFFILAGNFLTHGGVARRMIRFATSMVGHWHGGLGLASVLACALFAAVSGSSPATVVAAGSIILPAMAAQGFPKRFGTGVVTTSGALGILIPPSIVMVMYSVSTNTSVGRLFMAGILPGLMLAALLGLVTWYRARQGDYPRLPKANLKQRLDAFRDSAWGLLLIVVVIESLSAIDTPVRLLPGENDSGTPPACSEEIRERVPGTRLTVAPDAAHLSNVEQPGFVTAAMLEFLMEMEASAPVPTSRFRTF